MYLLPFGFFLINVYLEMNNKIDISPFLSNILFNFFEIVIFAMTTQISKKWMIVLINISRIASIAILLIVTPKYYKISDIVFMFVYIIFLNLSFTNDHMLNTRELLKSHFFSNLNKAIYIMIKSKAIFYFIKFVITNYSAKLYNEILMATSIIVVLTINFNVRNLFEPFFNSNSNDAISESTNRIIIKSEKKVKKNSILLKVITTIIINILYSFLLIVVVYSNYNKEFGNIMYDLTIGKLQQPNNLIIYNSIPNNPDQRFLILILFITFIKESL